MMNYSPATSQESVGELLAQLPRLKEEIQKRIVGQDDVLDQIMIGMLASGHVLLEGVPGLAKTLMIKTLAEAVSLSFNRIQFTPDLMPTDILGTEILQEDHDGKKYFKFNPGPVFNNLLLADEINRTPPKTQAALLELMQEYSVTYAGKQYPLPKPFFLLATQNPIEQSGTFALPEAQVDRFLLYITVPYPSAEEETRILESTTSGKEVEIHAIIGADELQDLQRLCREVFIAPELIQAVSKLIRNTRPSQTIDSAISNYVEWGGGPRAGQSLILAAKGRALLQGRYSVMPDDLHAMLIPTLQHRIVLNFKALSEKVSVVDLIQAMKLEIQ